MKNWTPKDIQAACYHAGGVRTIRSEETPIHALKENSWYFVIGEWDGDIVHFPGMVRYVFPMDNAAHIVFDTATRGKFVRGFEQGDRVSFYEII